MPKLPALTSKKLLKKLNRLGFVKDHTTGSHIIMYHPDGRRAVVPFHLKDIPKGTLASILRESGIDRNDLINA